MGTETVCYLSLHDLSGRIRQGEVSPAKCVEAFLQRIEEVNPRLSAFLTLCDGLPGGSAADGLRPRWPAALALDRGAGME
jgi:Asp-tRNA(Asn)/Glu-tRNA(Gln) amidotransferase A subunit family amidase